MYLSFSWSKNRLTFGVLDEHLVGGYVRVRSCNKSMLLWVKSERFMHTDA